MLQFPVSVRLVADDPSMLVEYFRVTIPIYTFPTTKAFLLDNLSERMRFSVFGGLVELETCKSMLVYLAEDHMFTQVIYF